VISFVLLLRDCPYDDEAKANHGSSFPSDGNDLSSGITLELEFFDMSQNLVSFKIQLSRKIPDISNFPDHFE